MEERLIELVRGYEALYNKEHRNYYDRRGVVANIWTEVATKMKAEGFNEFKG